METRQPPQIFRVRPPKAKAMRYLSDEHALQIADWLGATSLTHQFPNKIILELKNGWGPLEIFHGQWVVLLEGLAPSVMTDSELFSTYEPEEDR